MEVKKKINFSCAHKLMDFYVIMSGYVCLELYGERYNL